MISFKLTIWYIWEINYIITTQHYKYYMESKDIIIIRIYILFKILRNSYNIRRARDKVVISPYNSQHNSQLWIDFIIYEINIFKKNNLFDISARLSLVQIRNLTKNLNINLVYIIAKYFEKLRKIFGFWVKYKIYMVATINALDFSLLS